MSDPTNNPIVVGPCKTTRQVVVPNGEKSHFDADAVRGRLRMTDEESGIRCGVLKTREEDLSE